MGSQYNSTQKTKTGRPPTGQGFHIKLSLHAELLDPLDEWIAERNEPGMNRQKAIREFIRKGLGLKEEKSRVGPLSKRTRK